MKFKSGMKDEDSDYASFGGDSSSGGGSKRDTFIILREEDYSTERWYDICDILSIPHASTRASIRFDPSRDVECDES